MTVRTNPLTYIQFVQEHADEVLKQDANFQALIEGWQVMFEEFVPGAEREEQAKEAADPDGSPGDPGVFTFAHKLPNGEEASFTWNIAAARQWLDENNRTAQTLDVYPLKRYLTKPQLEHTVLSKDDPSPIIVFPALGFGGRLCVMHGAPKVLYALEQKQKSMAGFVLLREEHRHWMTDEAMRYFYEFLCDHMLFVIEHDAKKRGGRAARNMWRKTFLSKHIQKL